MAFLDQLRSHLGASDMGKVHPALEVDWLGRPSLLLRLSFANPNGDIVISLKPGEQVVLGRGTRRPPKCSLTLLHTARTSWVSLANTPQS
jgi:hypothetical protein